MDPVNSDHDNNNRSNNNNSRIVTSTRLHSCPSTRQAQFLFNQNLIMPELNFNSHILNVLGYVGLSFITKEFISLTQILPMTSANAPSDCWEDLVDSGQLDLQLQQRLNIGAGGGGPHFNKPPPQPHFQPQSGYHYPPPPGPPPSAPSSQGNPMFTSPPPPINHPQGYQAGIRIQERPVHSQQQQQPPPQRMKILARPAPPRQPQPQPQPQLQEQPRNFRPVPPAPSQPEPTPARTQVQVAFLRVYKRNFCQ